MSPKQSDSHWTSEIGLGYTLATGKLWCDFDKFHEFGEQLLGRPIFTHEFGGRDVWEELRERFEADVTATFPPRSGMGSRS